MKFSSLRKVFLRFLYPSIAFVFLASAFFWPGGLDPLHLFELIWTGSLGDGYAISETLVKATPILWCALAVAIPAQLGLVSIGAEGQMYLGAIGGFTFVIAFPHQTSSIMIPGMIACAGIAGGCWGFVPGWLKAKLDLNETVLSLLLNFVAIDLLDYLIHGPWLAPDSGNWPKTVPFPKDAVLAPLFTGYRVHYGLLGALFVAFALYFIARWSRWGVISEVLRHNPGLAPQIGVKYRRWVIVLMAVGGVLAGIGGIGEASAVQSRLESHFLSSYGLSGYLVTWLSQHHFLRILPFSVLVAVLLSAADGLQLSAQLPASTALILQGILFISVVAFGAWKREAV
jgi:ABC-type uncharacterized transport system permease subunit